MSLLGEVFKVFGTIAIDGVDKVNKQLDSFADAGSKAAEIVGKGLTTVAKVGAAAVGAVSAGLAVMLKESVQQYADYEQLVGGAQLLFGDAYDYVAAQSAQAYKTVQMSQNEYLQQVNGFAVGLKTALNGNEKAAAELSHKIIKAEADVVAATGNTQESVQNAFNGIMKSNFTMLDNLQIGITPTKEGFQEVIDKVNAWRKSQGITSNYVIDNLADCQSALVDYIEMQGLADYATNEAADTIQGSFASMKSAWSNFLVGAADSSQDFDVLLDGLIESALAFADNIVPRIIETAPRIVSGIMQLIEEIAPQLPELLTELLPSIIDGATSIVIALTEKLPEIIAQLVPVVLESAVEIINAIGEAFGISDLAGLIQSKFEEIGSYLSETFKPIIDDLSSVFTAVHDAIQSVIDKITEYVTSGEAAEDITSLLKGVCEGLASAYESVKEFITGVVDGFKDAVTWGKEHQTALEVIAVALGTVTAAIVAYNIAQAVKNAGGIVELVQLGGLAIGLAGLTAAEAAHTAASTIATAATTAFGAAVNFLTSPITLVILAIGALIAIGVVLYKNWDTIKEKASQLKKAVIDKFQEIKSGVVQKIEALKTSVTEKFNAIKEKITAPIKAAKETIKGIVDSIKGFFSGMKLEFPSIKLPHFAISPSGWKIGDLLKGTIPSLGIDWYAEGGVMEKPTVFGMNGNKAMVGGEAGSEAIAPIDVLQKYVSEAVANQNAAMVDILERILDAITSADENSVDRIRTAIDGSSLKVNKREFGRLVKAVE